MLISNTYFQNVVRGLTISFPILVLTLDHASGVIFFLLVLTGLFLYSPLKRDKPFTYNEQLLFSALIFFVFAAGIAILFGDDLSTGYRWFGKFLRFALVIPLYLLLRKIVVSESQFWTSLAAGAIFCGLVAIIEIYIGHIFGWGGGHVGRASGVTHPIMFGDISLTMGVMAFCGLAYFRRQSNWQIVLPILAITLGIIASFLSGSRGAWIALPALFLLLLWSMRHSIPKKALIVISAIMIVSPVLIYFMPGVNVASRIDTAFDHYDEYLNHSVDKNLMGNPVGIRLEMWQASWMIFKESPVTGVGWGNYQKQAQRLVKQGIRNPAIAAYRHPHNQYLSSLANGGLTGLAATISLLVLPLVIFYKAYRQDSESTKAFGIAGMVLVMAFAHFALTEGVFERNMTINFYGFFLALITALIVNHTTTVRDQIKT